MNKITSNKKTKLFTICTINDGKIEGYSCLGFAVCNRKLKAISGHYNKPELIIGGIGTLKQYKALEAAQTFARDQYNLTGKKCPVELTPQLIGLEGERVEVITTYGERRRFTVGKSTGWIPCHLEIENANDDGGGSAEHTYKSIRVI